MLAGEPGGSARSIMRSDCSGLPISVPESLSRIRRIAATSLPGAIVVFITEQIYALDRSERPAWTEVDVRSGALIESDRNKPGIAWRAQSELLDSKL